MGTTCARSCAATARRRRSVRPSSSARSATRWTRSIAPATCIATSSPPTCWSTTTATSTCRTSASPSRRSRARRDRVRPLGGHARLRRAGADPRRAVDARTDVYALGGVLHFILTGAVPFDRESDEAKLWAHLAEPPPLPSALGPIFPPRSTGSCSGRWPSSPMRAIHPRATSPGPHARLPGAPRPSRSGRSRAAPRRPARRRRCPGCSTAPTLPAGRLDGARRKRAVVAAGLLALVLAAAAASSHPGDDDDGDQRAGSAPAPGALAAHTGTARWKTLTAITGRPRASPYGGGVG